MPLIDMPLEKLYTYEGRTPCPADFDIYWDRALKELDETKADVEIKPSLFQVPYASCYDLYFTGVKKARIHVKYVQPHRPPQGHSHFPAMLEFHGYSMDSGDWSSKLAYAAAGFAVFSMDVRGQGGASEDPGGVIGNTLQGHVTRGVQQGEDALFFRNVYLDTVQLARLVMDMEKINESHVTATGWSQGGGLTLACAALEPRLKQIAPVYPFLSDFLRVWEMDLAEEAYQDLRRHFRRYDPTHARKDEFFRRMGYIDIQHLMPRIRAEVLMGTGLMDAVCPPSTQFAAFNKIKAPKEAVIFPDFAHERLPGLHDRIWEFFVEKS
ncbi:alpha/beta fold hydrolase [Alkalicoccus halolimnae]|uniref:Alpha/beta fold hydrolase n=1 Tax=Alkalicoccus halolimnae TaxID=1667239 RepID=A0A5C7F483_9BACI|nr:alpha/beta fold hydrolase [Alkalicoccus halolimnae]TXF84357.1 acetylxylan esterase [Alkalicoccus halolimnae]